MLEPVTPMRAKSIWDQCCCVYEEFVADFITEQPTIDIPIPPRLPTRSSR